ncbi:TPA: N-6 DNA methylase [Pseudomonas aeruginosa]
MSWRSESPFTVGFRAYVGFWFHCSPNPFYNSPMESCVMVCNRCKPAERKGKVLFIDALNEVTRERAQSFLKPEHQQRILEAFRAFAPIDGFAAVATLDQIASNGANLSIPFYVRRVSGSVNGNGTNAAISLRSAWEQWQIDGRAFWQQMDALVETLDGLEVEEVERA